MKMIESERKLQAAVATFLRHALPPDAMFFAVPNGARSDPKHVARLKREGLTPGAPDMMIVWRGRAIGLELKTARGVISDAQQAFAAAMHRAGASYYIARSLAEVELVLAAEGVGVKAEVAA